MMKKYAALFVVFVSLCFSVCQGTTNQARPFIFGMNPSSGIVPQGEWYDDVMLKVMKLAGTTNIRICASWEFLEPEPGKYDWFDMDRKINLLEKYDIEPFCLVCNTPRWALKPDQHPAFWPPLPQYMKHLEDFCYNLAKRYRGRIKYYEFWNEENGCSWHETNHPEDYVPMLKLAYKNLKKGDPSCVVALGGLDGSGWKGYYKYLESVYRLGGDNFFDAVAVHPYDFDGHIDLDGMRSLRKVLEKHGHGHKKFWLTEYGWNKSFGEEARARWMKETLDILTDPEFDYIFQASHHTVMDFDKTEMGLVDTDLLTRPAYHVFAAYPKAWPQPEKKITFRPTAANSLKLKNGSFEQKLTSWKLYSDKAQVFSAFPQDGRYYAGIRGQGERAVKGGMYQVCSVKRGDLVKASAMVYSERSGGDPKKIKARIGFDPAGGTNPGAKGIIWHDGITCTYDAWECIVLGFQKGPIKAAKDKITLFLEYAIEESNPSAEVYFDRVMAWSFPPDYAECNTNSGLPQNLAEKVLPLPLKKEKEPPSFGHGAIFSDDFEDKTLRKWDKGDGAWFVEDGRLRRKPRSKNFAFLEAKAKLPASGDWILRARGGNRTTLSIGLWIGKDADNCVLYSVQNWKERNNIIKAFRRDGKFVHEKRERYTHPLKPGARQTFSWEKKRQVLQALLNGEEIFQIKVSDCPGQSFGVYLIKWRYGWFDWIELFLRS